MQNVPFLLEMLVECLLQYCKYISLFGLSSRLTLPSERTKKKQKKVLQHSSESVSHFSRQSGVHCA